MGALKRHDNMAFWVRHLIDLTRLDERLYERLAAYWRWRFYLRVFSTCSDCIKSMNEEDEPRCMCNVK
jgi:hypothetical protein